MTHQYTVLIGGVVLPGGGAADGLMPSCSAIAWASDTVLALGSDAEVLGITRGDSAVVALDGLVVVPLADGGVLEVGGLADLAVLAGGARAGAAAVIATVRGGKIVQGELPGLDHDASSPDAHGPPAGSNA